MSGCPIGQVRRSYLRAAEAGIALLHDPRVATAWTAASALPEFPVNGLAGHLAAQVLQVPVVLAEPPRNAAPLTLAEHYGRAAWIGATLDAPVNVAVRTAGERYAAGGPAALARRTQVGLSELRTLLARQPDDRVVFVPWAGWALTLDDFLVTRMVELAVHADDLAASVGAEAPELPAEVLDPVLATLVRLAVRRHGQSAVLRAFARAERAPEHINVI